jgi:hypothetical protein
MELVKVKYLRGGAGVDFVRHAGDTDFLPRAVAEWKAERGTVEIVEVAEMPVLPLVKPIEVAINPKIETAEKAVSKRGRKRK